MTQQSILKDEDLLYTILADLKRTSNEYATAVTEANCTEVRQQFQGLLQDTLNLQGQLYTFMSQQGMYSASSPAIASEITKQIQSSSQTQTETNQLIHQYIGVQ
ncbi:spore coat protein [Ectobacillus sp. sgz5001026]|uniref:spore coat protein n=1 Tax=Ectobacillus sp. sgz5001026 TaxID=3242473 RepID=UPI0036D301B7